MIFICINHEFESVDRIAAKHFQRKGSSSANYWSTKNPIDGVQRGFYLFPDTCADVPKYDKGAVLRAYEEDILLMAAGEKLDQRVKEMTEKSPNFPIILKISPGVVNICTELPEKMKKQGIETGYASRSWQCSETGFGRMMAELWEPAPAEAWAAYELKFDIPSQKSSILRRNDLELMIAGNPAVAPNRDALILNRVIFDPANFDSEGKRIYNREGGTGPAQYIQGDNGAYFHPSAVHTGEQTAKACGVDLSQFSDSGRD